MKKIKKRKKQKNSKQFNRQFKKKFFHGFTVFSFPPQIQWKSIAMKAIRATG